MNMDNSLEARDAFARKQSTKTEQFKSGEQHVYAYQEARKISTLVYAIKNLFR